MPTETRSFSPEKLRELRERAGLSRRALGDLIFVSQLTISTYEQGRNVPSTRALARLAVALQVAIDDLFDVEFVEEHARVGA